MRLLGVFVLGIFPAVLSAQDEKKNPFEGTWEVVKLEVTGSDISEGLKAAKATFTFKGDAYTCTLGESEEKGTFKLDPKAKTIDLDIKDGQAKGKKQLGIYKFDGETLTVCLGDEGADVRPTKFTTGEDVPEFAMFTLKKK